MWNWNRLWGRQTVPVLLMPLFILRYDNNTHMWDNIDPPIDPGGKYIGFMLSYAHVCEAN